MSLRNAALFAIIGTALWTSLLAVNLLNSLVALSRGVVAASSTFSALIHFVAALSLLVFFAVFRRSQS